MTKLEAVERKIRELVPRTMELSFGCECVGGAFNEPLIYHYYGADQSEYGNGNDGHYLICLDRRGSVFTSTVDFKIIGHPITLEDVLEAIGQSGDYGISSDGDLLEHTGDDRGWRTIACKKCNRFSEWCECTPQFSVKWHFGKPLSDQTELINWLYEFFNLSE